MRPSSISGRCAEGANVLDVDVRLGAVCVSVCLSWASVLRSPRLSTQINTHSSSSSSSDGGDDEKISSYRIAESKLRFLIRYSPRLSENSDCKLNFPCQAISNRFLVSLSFSRSVGFVCSFSIPSNFKREWCKLESQTGKIVASIAASRFQPI